MIYHVPPEKIEMAADAAADAFIGARDPIGIFIFEHEPNHLALKRRFYRALVTSCPATAITQGSSPAFEAVSIWFPPSMDHSGDEEQEPFTEDDFTNPLTMSRLEAVGGVIDALTGCLGEEPQWYLHLVAVRPGFAGKGYASALVKPMMQKAAVDGLPCTLITQTMDNVRKYEHWGFEIVKVLPVPGSVEKFCYMRRD